VLSVDVPKPRFGEGYAGLKAIRIAFGRRALVLPVSLDHHEVDSAEFLHMVDLEGRHEAEVHFLKKRIDGGPHILLAIEADETERNHTEPPGVEMLEALEAILRATLGNSSLVCTRDTRLISIADGSSNTISPDIHNYGMAEAARAETTAIDAAVELLAGASALPVDLRRRIMLGLRWANIAFKGHDLLSAWTALEILAGEHGKRVFRMLSKAYTPPTTNPQALAQRLGVLHIYSVRNAFAHDGAAIYYSSSAASLLLAIAHDLARALANLTSQKNAERVLNDCGQSIEDMIRIV
jgi:hypothetical protein